MDYNTSAHSSLAALLHAVQSDSKHTVILKGPLDALQPTNPTGSHATQVHSRQQLPCPSDAATPRPVAPPSSAFAQPPAPLPVTTTPPQQPCDPSSSVSPQPPARSPAAASVALLSENNTQKNPEAVAPISFDRPDKDNTHEALRTDEAVAAVMPGENRSLEASGTVAARSKPLGLHSSHRRRYKYSRSQLLALGQLQLATANRLDPGASAKPLPTLQLTSPLLDHEAGLRWADKFRSPECQSSDGRSGMFNVPVLQLSAPVPSPSAVAQHTCGPLAQVNVDNKRAHLATSDTPSVSSLRSTQGAGRLSIVDRNVSGPNRQTVSITLSPNTGVHHNLERTDLFVGSLGRGSFESVNHSTDQEIFEQQAAVPYSSQLQAGQPASEQATHRSEVSISKTEPPPSSVHVTPRTSPNLRSKVSLPPGFVNLSNRSTSQIMSDRKTSISIEARGSSGRQLGSVHTDAAFAVKHRADSVVSDGSLDLLKLNGLAIESRPFGQDSVNAHRVATGIGSSIVPSGFLHTQALVKSKIAKGPGHRPPFDSRIRYHQVPQTHLSTSFTSFSKGQDISLCSRLEKCEEQAPLSLSTRTITAASRRAIEIDRLFDQLVPVTGPDGSQIDLVFSNSLVTQVDALQVIKHDVNVAETSSLKKDTGMARCIDSSSQYVAQTSTSSSSKENVSSPEKPLGFDSVSEVSPVDSQGTNERHVSEAQSASKYDGSKISDVSGGTANFDSLSEWFSKLGASMNASQVESCGIIASAVKDNHDTSEPTPTPVDCSILDVCSGESSPPFEFSESVIPNELSCDGDLTPDVLSFFTAVRAQAAIPRRKTEEKIKPPNRHPVETSTDAPDNQHISQSVVSSNSAISKIMESVSTPSPISGLLRELEVSAARKSPEQESITPTSDLELRNVPENLGEPSVKAASSQSESVERFFKLFKEHHGSESTSTADRVRGTVKSSSGCSTSSLEYMLTDQDMRGVPRPVQLIMHPYHGIPLNGLSTGPSLIPGIVYAGPRLPGTVDPQYTYGGPVWAGGVPFVCAPRQSSPESSIFLSNAPIGTSLQARNASIGNPGWQNQPSG